MKKKDVEKAPKKKKTKGNGSLNIFKVNGEFKLIPLIINILIPLGGGFLVGLITNGSMDTYNKLVKPSFTPPGYLFPIAWTILYILMGIAAYRIYMRSKQGVDDKGAYFVYLIQLFFNFMWSFIFFSFRLYGLAFIWLLIMLALIILTFIKFIKIDKTAAYLLIPYMLWVTFAGVLNYFIWMYNEM